MAFMEMNLELWVKLDFEIVWPRINCTRTYENVSKVRSCSLNKLDTSNLWDIWHFRDPQALLALLGMLQPRAFRFSWFSV